MATKLTAKTAILASATADADLLMLTDVSAGSTHKMVKTEAHKMLVSDHFASQAQAEALALDTVIVTPLKLGHALAAFGFGWEFVEDTYDFAVDGAVASVESAALADDYVYAWAVVGVKLSATSANIFVDQYGASLAAYTGQPARVSATNSATADDAFAWVEFPLSRLSSNFKPVVVGASDMDANISGNDGYGSATNASGGGHHFSAAQKVDKMKFYGNGANLNAGKIIMYRRRVA